LVFAWPIAIYLQIILGLHQRGLLQIAWLFSGGVRAYALGFLFSLTPFGLLLFRRDREAIWIAGMALIAALLVVIAPSIVSPHSILTTG